MGTVQVHMDPSPHPLIKSNKNDKYCVEIKLRRYPTSQKLDPYEFKMVLFDNGDPEELFLFIRNFNNTLKASGTLLDGAKIQYLCTLLCGEALQKFDTFYAEVGSMTSENLKSDILGLGT